MAKCGPRPQTLNRRELRKKWDEEAKQRKAEEEQSKPTFIEPVQQPRPRSPKRKLKNLHKEKRSPLSPASSRRLILQIETDNRIKQKENAYLDLMVRQRLARMGRKISGGMSTPPNLSPSSSGDSFRSDDSTGSPTPEVSSIAAQVIPIKPSKWFVENPGLFPLIDEVDFDDKPTFPQRNREHSTRFVVSPTSTPQPGLSMLAEKFDNSTAISSSKNATNTTPSVSHEPAASLSEGISEPENIKTLATPQNIDSVDSISVLVNAGNFLGNPSSVATAATVTQLPSTPDLNLLPKVRIPKTPQSDSAQSPCPRVLTTKKTVPMTSSQTLQGFKPNKFCSDLEMSSNASNRTNPSEKVHLGYQTNQSRPSVISDDASCKPIQLATFQPLSHPSKTKWLDPSFHITIPVSAPALSLTSNPAVLASSEMAASKASLSEIAVRVSPDTVAPFSKPAQLTLLTAKPADSKVASSMGIHPPTLAATSGGSGPSELCMQVSEPERLSPRYLSIDTIASDNSSDGISKQAQFWVEARRMEWRQRRMANTSCFIRAAESSRQIQELIKAKPVVLSSQNEASPDNQAIESEKVSVEPTVEPVKNDDEPLSVTPSNSHERPPPIKKGDMFPLSNDGLGAPPGPRRYRYKPVRAFVDFSPTKTPSWASQMPASDSSKQITPLQSSDLLCGPQVTQDQSKTTHEIVRITQAPPSDYGCYAAFSDDPFSTSRAIGIKYVRSGSQEHMSAPKLPGAYSPPPKGWRENISPSFSDLALPQQRSLSSSCESVASSTVAADQNWVPIPATTESVAEYRPAIQLLDVPKPVANVERWRRDVPHAATTTTTTVGWGNGRAAGEKAPDDGAQARQGFFGLLSQGLFGGWR